MPEELSIKLANWSYSDHEKTDWLTLTFDNQDRTLFNYKFLQVGVIIRFRHGYMNPEELSRYVYFKIVDRKGFEDLKIECQEITSIIGFSEQKSKYWLDSELTPIVQEIATENQVPKIETVERKDRTGTVLNFDYFQPGVEDFAFLYNLGRAIGYQVWFEDDTLYFLPRQYGQTPYMKFGYYSLSGRDFRIGEIGEGQIVEFKPQQNAMHKRGEFAAGGIDYETKESFFIKEKGETKKVTYLGSKLWDYDAQMGRFKKLKKARLVRVPLRNKQEAEDVLGGRWIEETSDAITADMVLVGEPNIRARRVVQVDNVGPYTGKYYVKEVTHSFGSGPYESVAKLSRNAAFDDESGKYSINVLNGLVNRNRMERAAFLEELKKKNDPSGRFAKPVMKQK
jgi:phage protein D